MKINDDREGRALTDGRKNKGFRALDIQGCMRIKNSMKIQGFRALDIQGCMRIQGFRALDIQGCMRIKNSMKIQENQRKSKEINKNE